MERPNPPSWFTEPEAAHDPFQAVTKLILRVNTRTRRSHVRVVQGALLYLGGFAPPAPPYRLSRALLRRALQSRGLTRFARSLLIQRASPVSQRL